jgi:hypothetical protein
MIYLNKVPQGLNNEKLYTHYLDMNLNYLKVNKMKITNGLACVIAEMIAIPMVAAFYLIEPFLYTLVWIRDDKQRILGNTRKV